MYVSQTNPLALRSQKELAQALISLMSQYPYREITITQICQEAQLVRKTFYRNFQTKEDVLLFILDQLLDELCRSVMQHPLPLDFREEIELCFAFFYQQKKLLTLLKVNSLLYLFAEKTVQYLIHTACAEESNLALAPDMAGYFHNLIASSTTATVELWINRDFDRTPAELAQFMFQVLHQGYQLNE